jgi:hypothetical protein
MSAIHVVSGRTIAWWIPNVWNIEEVETKNKRTIFQYIYIIIYIVLFCVVISFTACLHIPYIPNIPVVEPQSSWFLTTSGLGTEITQKCTQDLWCGTGHGESGTQSEKLVPCQRWSSQELYIYNYTSYMSIYIELHIHIYMWYSATIGWKENLKGSRELRFLGLITRVYCFLLSPIYWYIEYTVIYVSL